MVEPSPHVLRPRLILSTELRGSENIPFFFSLLVFKHDISFPEKAIAENIRILFLEFARQICIICFCLFAYFLFCFLSFLTLVRGYSFLLCFFFLFSLCDPHSNIVRVTVLSESQKLLILHNSVFLQFGVTYKGGCHIVQNVCGPLGSRINL